MMSSPDSLTSSLNSITNESKCDLATVLSCDLENDFVTMSLVKTPLEALDSENPSISEEVLEKECDDWAPVDYCGTMTRPLAYFGTFEVKPETKEFPWISDNTSGAVHPDMPTISMLFNEDLTLPKVAENFVAQSPVLQEEARWERVKAAFYSFYPQGLKRQVFEVLSKMLSRDASRIIAQKTLRFENEVILKPNPKKIDPWVDTDPDSDPDTETESDHRSQADGCNEEDALKLNQEFPKIAREYRENIATALNHTKSPREELAVYQSFKATEVVFKKESIPCCMRWVNERKEYQKRTMKYMETCLLTHHFGHAVARYEPRTGWIHVNTQLLHQNPGENKLLPKGIFDLKLFSEYKIRGTREAQRAAINKQMKCFEHGFQDNTKGHLRRFDSCYSEPDFHEFRFCLPCEKVSPDYCGTVLQQHLLRNERYRIISTPQILSFPMLHHEMTVYIQTNKHQSPRDLISGNGSTLQYVDSFGCCLNCFSKTHCTWNCNLPKYGFALAT